MNAVLDFFDTLQEMIYIADLDSGQIVYMNTTLREALGGLTQEEYQGERGKAELGRIFGCDFQEQRHKLEPGKSRVWLWKDPTSGRNLIKRCSRHDFEGRRYWLESVLETSLDSDWTSLRTGEDGAMETAEALDRYLLHNYHDLPFFFSAFSQNNQSNYFYFGDVEKDVYYISDNMREKFGFPGNVVKSLPQEWIQFISTERDKVRYLKEMDRLLRERDYVYDLRYQARDRLGRNIWFHAYGEMQWSEDGTHPLFLAGRMSQQDERFMVDPVTNFPQASVLIEHLEQIRTNGQPCLAIGFSLNHITQINSIQGRAYGDFLIHSIATQLEEQLSQQMSFYRMLGMRCLALVGPEAEADRETMVAQIRTIVEKNYRWAGIALQNPCSFAVMHYPQPGITARDFIENMEGLIRLARERKDQLFVDNSQGSVRRIQEEASMALYIGQDVLSNMEDFRAVVQPVVSTKSGEIVGGEMLLRWKFMGSDVSPGIFIPILERDGMIQATGRWIFEQAVRTCKQALPLHPDFSISVNVSLQQLSDLELGGYIRETLAKYQLDGRHIIVEMTESCMDQQPELLQRFVENCADCGIRIALDDFGSGYSSFRVLLHYPSGIIKLDRSLLLEMTESADKMNFISSVVYACHSFGKQVYIEGVETEEQKNLAMVSKCDVIQGFYYYRPMELKQLFKLLAEKAEECGRREKEAAAQQKAFPAAREELSGEGKLDTLTGLDNRKAGTRRMVSNLETCESYLFVMLDIDHFHRVNECCGLQQGEQALRFVADSLRTTFRKSDVIFRLGGDAFAALILNCRNDIQIIERKLKEVVWSYTEQMQKCCPDAESSLSVGGVYSRDKHGVDILYQLAEQVLEETKRHAKGHVRLNEI